MKFVHAYIEYIKYSIIYNENLFFPRTIMLVKYTGTFLLLSPKETLTNNMSFGSDRIGWICDISNFITSWSKVSLGTQSKNEHKCRTWLKADLQLWPVIGVFLFYYSDVWFWLVSSSLVTFVPMWRTFFYPHIKATILSAISLSTCKSLNTAIQFL